VQITPIRWLAQALVGDERLLASAVATIAGAVVLLSRRLNIVSDIRDILLIGIGLVVAVVVPILLRAAAQRTAPLVRLTFMLLGLSIILIPFVLRETYFYLVVAVTTIGSGSALQLFGYLQGVGSLSSRFQDVYPFGSQAVASPLSNEIQEDLAQLRDEIRKRTPVSISFSDAEKTEIVSKIREIVVGTLTTDFLSAIDTRYSGAALRQSSLAGIVDDFRALRMRLLEEVDALQRRANSNLAIGSVTTLLAMGTLAWVVLHSFPNFSALTPLMSYYIPRVSFVVFIEIFAFFFLKLYKANLEDAKFYQNELTNIDSKLIALKATLMESREQDISNVVQELARTERNFILRKDETTVELERTRIERSAYKETMDRAVSLVDKIRPKA